MKGDSRAASAAVSELLVRPALPDFGKPQLLQDGDDFAWLQNGNIAHGSGDGDVLHSHKLRLQNGLAVLKQHSDDFLKVMVELVHGCALRVRAREARDKADECAGLRTPLDNSRVGSHDADP